MDKTAEPERSELADMVGPLWTAQHTRRVLNISRSAMLERCKTGALLALKATDGGDDLYCPLAQFERRDGKTQVRPALAEFHDGVA